jgi:ATP/maltotriose-dependent transcriptional regulator MalT
MSRAELGDLDGAWTDVREARRLAEETSGRGGQGVVLMGMAALHRMSGRLDEALELAERAHATLDPQAERMAPHGEAMVLAELTRVMVARGDLSGARRNIDTAVALGLTTEDMPIASAVVEVAASVELMAGDAELAARTLGLAAAIRGVRTIPDQWVRRTVEGAVAALGEAAYEDAFRSGEGLRHDDAMAELRKRFTAPTDRRRAGLLSSD